MAMNVVDPVAAINSKRAQLDKVRTDAASAQGKVAVLREQYNKKCAEMKEKFQCTTPEDLAEKIRAMEAELSTKSGAVLTALSAYETGDYETVLNLVGSQT